MTRALLLIVALFCGSPSVALAEFTSLYVFGDSLSDNGNAFELSDNAWPPTPPYAQRFSNGPVTPEYLADLMGIQNFAPSTLGGTDYAVGGATTGTRNFSFEAGLPPGLPDETRGNLDNTGMLNQAGLFLGSSPSFDPTTSLFTVWGGPNDFFLAFVQDEDPLSTLSNAIGNISTIIALLANAGATEFLVPNMGNLAQTPFGLAQSPEAQAALDALSQAFNQGLAQALDTLRQQLLIDIIEVDVAGLFDAVVADPGAFGFTNTTIPCLAVADPTTIPPCPGFLFLDEVHPTTAAHQLLAQFFFAQIPQQVPEPGTLALVTIAVFAAGATRRARRHAGHG